MAQVIVRRLLMAIPVIFGATLSIFLLLQLGPGDPAVISAGGIDADTETIEAVREALGLNRPILVQYGEMMSNFLRGDMGTSLHSSEPVAEAILQRAGVTASLAVVTVIIGAMLAIPAGIIAAARRDSNFDRLVVASSTVGIATPQFFIGLILVLLLRETFFPAIGFRPITEGLRPWLLHLILPGFAIGLVFAAELVRHVRGSMLSVLDKYYIRTARAKGVSERIVLSRHALKNASLPVLTVLGAQFQSVIGGIVSVEVVFGMPGLGSLLIRVALSRDYPMIQGLLIFIVLATVIVNIVVDLLYSVMNPKIRAA